MLSWFSWSNWSSSILTSWQAPRTLLKTSKLLKKIIIWVADLNLLRIVSWLGFIEVFLTFFRLRPHTHTHSRCVAVGAVMAWWIERWTCNLRLWVRILGPAGIVGGESEQQAFSPPLIPWLRWDPWARHRTPSFSPDAAAMAAHCSGCVFTTVSVHLDVLNAQILSMGHHTWPLIISYHTHTHINAMHLLPLILPLWSAAAGCELPHANVHWLI